MPQARERQLILFAVAALLGGGVLLWTLVEIKGVLLVLYVSGLLAIGFSPAVRRFERDSRQLTRTDAPALGGDPPALSAPRPGGRAGLRDRHAAVRAAGARAVGGAAAVFRPAPERAPARGRAERAVDVGRRHRAAAGSWRGGRAGGGRAQGRVRRRRHDRDGADPAGVSAARSRFARVELHQALPARPAIASLAAHGQRDREGRRVAQRPAAALGHHRHVGRASACGRSACRTSTCSRCSRRWARWCR